MCRGNLSDMLWPIVDSQWPSARLKGGGVDEWRVIGWYAAQAAQIDMQVVHYENTLKSLANLTSVPIITGAPAPQRCYYRSLALGHSDIPAPLGHR